MKFLGNLIWVLFGGWFTALSWLVYGVLWSITIIGIPMGKQCFKFAKLSFMPFDKEVKETNSGAISFIANLIWALTTGIPMALEYVLLGVIFCVTIIGIPFGKQYFKLARLSFAPFNCEVK